MPITTVERIKRGLALLTSALFLLLICAPAAEMRLQLTPVRKIMITRWMYQWPAFKWNTLLTTYPREFDYYFRDNFGLRTTLIKWNSYLKVVVLGISPAPRVLAGKNEMLFYRGREADTIADYRGANRFTAAELDTIVRNLRERQAWLARSNIKFVMLIAPNKATIYPENVPRRIRRVHAETRIDQIYRAVRERTTIPIIDVRPALRAAKAGRPVYRNYDPHWSEYGAYLAYREIVRELSRHFPAIGPDSAVEYRFTPRDIPGGQLADIVNLGDVLFERGYRMSPVHAPRAEYVLGDPGLFDESSHSVPQIARVADESLPRIMFLRDSFLAMVAAPLSEHCSLAIHSPYNHYNRFQLGIGAVENYQPELVLLEIVERFLDALLIENPPEVRQALPPGE